MQTNVQTVAISLGRNIGAEPMPQHAWEEFYDRAYREVQLVPSATILAQTLGKGQWTDAAGKTVSEDTAIILAHVPDCYIPQLKVILAHLAYIYAQDGIGFTACSATDSYVTAENPGRTLASAAALQEIRNNG